MKDTKQNTLQKRFEHVLHNNKSKDIIASLISNADALDKSLARILGTKSENFVIDPHSRKTGLVISDIKGSDKNIVVFVDGNADDGIVISGALKKDIKVTRKIPADSSVKRITGMIATVIYEMDSTDFSTQDSANNQYGI
jgi:hypothetical protein